MVTGGAGFIGSHLVRRLLSRSCEVAVLDDLRVWQGAPDRRPALPPDAEFFEVDLCQSEAVATAVSSWKPDFTVHLAALHFIPYCQANPAETLAVNVVGTQNVLDALAGLREPCPIVLASTADVYEPSLEPHVESAAVGPNNVYGLSKLVTEHLGRMFEVTAAVPVTILRLFNVYGPGETNPHFIPAILEQLHRGRDLRLGNLDSKRDYVFVEDVVRTIVSLLPLSSSITVNVCTGRSHSGHEVIHCIERILGQELLIEQGIEHLRPSDRPNLQGDCGLLKTLLHGFEAVTLTYGLRQLLLSEGLLDPSPEIAAGEQA